MVYLQLIIGALMRHFQAGLAIPDLPLAYGENPPAAEPGAFGRRQSPARFQAEFGPGDPGPDLAALWSSSGAIAVTIVEILLISAIVTRHRAVAKLLWPALLLFVLLMSQLTLALLTVYYRKPADVASATWRWRGAGHHLCGCSAGN